MNLVASWILVLVYLQCGSIGTFAVPNHATDRPSPALTHGLHDSGVQQQVSIRAGRRPGLPGHPFSTSHEEAVVDEETYDDSDSFEKAFALQSSAESGSHDVGVAVTRRVVHFDCSVHAAVRSIIIRC